MFIQLVAKHNKTGNLNKELGILTIAKLIKIENCKFGYKLKNKLLPNKTQEICYLDSNNEDATTVEDFKNIEFLEDYYIDMINLR